MFRKITSQKPDRFPKPVRFEVGNYLSEKLYKENSVDLLAQSIGLSKTEIFYNWCFRKIRQSGIIVNSDWKYFFHGLECDLRLMIKW
jgi:hypothetical protein